jgi:hypothetical protein
MPMMQPKALMLFCCLPSGTSSGISIGAVLATLVERPLIIDGRNALSREDVQPMGSTISGLVESRQFRKWHNHLLPKTDISLWRFFNICLVFTVRVWRRFPPTS